MYPLTDDPDYQEQFESFSDMRACVEGLDECLNMVVSWLVAQDEDEPGPWRFFGLLIFMPRKSKTSEFRCRVADDEWESVREWIDTYLRARSMRWYGFTDD